MFIRMSFDIQELLLFNCLNFNDKTLIILVGDMNLLLNLLVSQSMHY